MSDGILEMEFDENSILTCLHTYLQKCYNISNKFVHVFYHSLFEIPNSHQNYFNMLERIFKIWDSVRVRNSKKKYLPCCETVWSIAGYRRSAKFHQYFGRQTKDETTSFSKSCPDQWWKVHGKGTEFPKNCRDTSVQLIRIYVRQNDPHRRTSWCWIHPGR